MIDRLNSSSYSQFLRSRWPVAVVAVLLSSACLQPENGQMRKGATARNVVLISVDTLRPDHTSAYGYERDTTPEIVRWFESGRLYSQAFTTEAFTTPALISALTGKLPWEHGVRMLYQDLPPDLVLSG